VKLSCHHDKIPEKSHLREEGFILAHGFNPSWQEDMVEQSS
jgi:hypothetical protein